MRTILTIYLLILLPNFLIGQKITLLGNGLTMRGTVYDIKVDQLQNKIYAVGDFSGINGVEMSKVGFWENENWHRIPDSTPIEGYVFCATVHNGTLFIGGNFTIKKNQPIINLAKLENGTWTSLGVEDMSGSIRTMTWYDDALYVSGDFRNINGIRHNGVMKYSNGQWQDGGLHSSVNAKGLQVAGDTLLAWGSGFAPDDHNSHTVSILKNNTWTTLPNVNSNPSISTACIQYKGSIFITDNNSVYRFDFDTYEWKFVTTLPFNMNASDSPPILFAFNETLYITTPDFRLFKFTNPDLVPVDIQGLNNIRNGNINAIATWNNTVLIGGIFLDWPSKTVSMAKISNQIASTFGQVSSEISLNDSWNYSVARSIVEYNNKYLIAGVFSFANNLFSPNLVYWDGVEFSPFEVPLPDGIRKLVYFENELYAIPHNKEWSNPTLAPFRLIKFDGVQWKGVEAPITFDNIDIVNDKLFLSSKYGIDYEIFGGPYYLKNGAWKSLDPYPFVGQIPRYSYKDVVAYQDGLAMIMDHDIAGNQIVFFPNDSSEWEVLVPNIDINGNYLSLKICHDTMYILNELQSGIYRVNSDKKIDTLSKDVETELGHFFSMNGQIFYSSWNGETHKVNDKLKFYNQLRVRDSKKLNHNTYLVALQGGYYFTGIDRKNLNNIGLLTFEPLRVTAEQDKEVLCPKNYVEYVTSTNHLNVTYSWEFEGGIPSTSASYFPMVRYDSPGIYQTKLVSYTVDGDTSVNFLQVNVNDCETPIPITANYDNNWIMGYEYWPTRGLGGFDFTFPDTILTPRYHVPFELNDGTAVMSDKNGNLQFYTNGRSIYNMENIPIAGSECFNSLLQNYGLDYFISSQSILSLPDVSQENVYHIFDIDPLNISGEYWLAGSNLSLNTIDMAQNNGLGQIVTCNEILLSDTLLNSTMQATKHANGKDWWIVVGKYKSDDYYKILVTENGSVSIETSNWDIYLDTLFDGQSTFSPDGKYFAQIFHDNQEVNIWEFDNTTGELFNRQIYTIATLDDYETPYGCSFSPDSRFLYISSLSQLRQLDLCTFDDISMEHIDTWDGNYEFIYPLFFGKQMMTPNQKIIVTSYGNGYLSFGVINNPNQKGRDCNFKQHSLKISDQTRNTANNLTLFPHFRAYPSYIGDCESVQTVENDPTNTLKIFPNPVGSQSVVHFSKKIKGEMYSSIGKLIFSFHETNYLDISTLSAGIYFIRSNEGSYKIIKQ